MGEEEEVSVRLRELYATQLREVECATLFDRMGHDLITDAELMAKPMVLCLGQYSTGKTSLLRGLIGRDFPGQFIAPEPTTERFHAIVHGQQDRTIQGHAATVVERLPFAGLAKFGQRFLNKLEVAVCNDSENGGLLKDVTLIDTPGVLSGEKQRVSRGYPFADVCGWFAHRAHLILLLFDAHKLDISDEFKGVVEQLRHHDGKVACVLNKADQLEPEHLMRVYGALMWSLGKILQSPECARIYVGSYQQPGPEPEPEPEPRSHPASAEYEDGGPSGAKAPLRSLFARDREELLGTLHSLPQQAAIRKISDMTQRLRRLKVHMYVLDHLRSQMPHWWGHAEARKRLIRDDAALAAQFEQVRTKYGLAEGDLPDVSTFREHLRAQEDFRSLPVLDSEYLRRIDHALGTALPQLMSLVSNMDPVSPAEPVASAERSPSAASAGVSAATVVPDVGTTKAAGFTSAQVLLFLVTLIAILACVTLAMVQFFVPFAVDTSRGLEMDWLDAVALHEFQLSH